MGNRIKRILIIDDDEDIRDILREVMESAGYHADIAEDGTRGMRLQKQEPYHLIITDIIMPGKEGIETILELKSNFRDLKIIAISGGGRISGDDYLNIARKIGADRVLTKPFSNNEIVEQVRELIG